MTETINEVKEVKVWSRAEKILLPVSLLLAVLFNRLVINNIWSSTSIGMLHAVFWLCYLVIFYAVYWKRLKNDYVLWFVAACTFALMVWNFIFTDSNWQFAMITAAVIPAVLMAHAQWAARGFSWKSFDGAVIDMVIAWLEGWLIRPFSGLGSLFEISASMVSSENKSTAKHASVGVAIVMGLMIVIIPLLMGADQVFSHYVSQFFSRLQFSSFIFHGVFVLIAFGLFFSFLWNIGFGENRPAVNTKVVAIDKIISTIVLGGVIAVYVLFCFVQFTYLFARAGLPAGMTFAEYAREGFAQTVAVCAINLLIFGVFLWRGSRGRLLSVLLCTLLTLTGIMLFSGAIRLSLYIDAFGMTWLRLLSAWFIIYLAAVVILCGVRLVKRLPVIGACALLLLVWYVALGFLNPDGFIFWYNVVR
ncbi:MAG: DUF4173 domain-containing protein [Defluviitaleaceae bacterium]|nr:DUF4173 domain-containing protein [Defluviitaleaceae bacterium]